MPEISPSGNLTRGNQEWDYQGSHFLRCMLMAGLQPESVLLPMKNQLCGSNSKNKTVMVTYTKQGILSRVESLRHDLWHESDGMISWAVRKDTVYSLVTVMDMDGKICSLKFVTQSHFQGSETWTEFDLMFLLYEWNMASFLRKEAVL